MTAPRVDLTQAPMTRILSPEEFAAAQQLPTTAPLRQSGPLGDTGVSRVLSFDEWQHAQTMPGPAVRQLKIPAIPRDVTAGMNPNTPTAKGSKIDGVTGAILRQAVNPMLENPLTTAGLPLVGGAPIIGPAVGAVFGGMMLSNIAQYGYQKALEIHATPDQRKEMEADPERISGESAAVQAAMLGLAPLIHVGVKSYRNLDVSTGMMDGAARAAAESTAPNFRPGFNDAHKNADFAASLDRAGEVTDANQRFGIKAPPPKGFEATASTSRAGAGAKSIDGMTVPVEPVENTPAAIEQAGRANAVSDYNATRVEQELADLRAADAERVNMAPRRRPKGEKQPFFETEQGAQTLGAAAARHGLPDDANPYHAATMPAEAAAWQEGHGAATESFPEGFSMGGALNENRIPSDYKVPRVPGFEPHIADVPDGVTHETIALADALKPSRFRGHSESELVSAAVDAQDRMEAAQTAAQRAPLRQLTGERAQADMENRGTSIADETESQSKSADRELLRAKSQLTQIEREATLRGMTGDDLAQRISDEKAARAERQGMSEDQALAAHTGADDPFGEHATTPTEGASSLTPIEGTGATQTRGLSRGVVQKALANHLDATVGEMPQYRSVSMADQSERAVQLLEDNPTLARQVALGQAPAPEGLLPESVFVAVENHAIETGDVGTIRELATGKLTSEATTMGQRIRTLAERDPDSPVGAIKKVIEVRMGGAENVPRATEEVVADLRKKLAGVKITREQWQSFVDSLRC